MAAFRSFISNFDELQALEKSEDLKDLHGKIFVSDMAALKDKLLSQDFLNSYENNVYFLS
ncbi:MAG: hypothetical protein P0116_13340 [Candidatus Nitrosocosmicus sp.]|nr:hypothetical protein [Candidatus Nitrosocosmicus sp.]